MAEAIAAPDVGWEPLPDHLKFTTIVGRGLLEELRVVAATPVVVVTMRDLWETHGLSAQSQLAEPPCSAHVHFVETIEASELEAMLSKVPTAPRTVIGLGGGQAIDVAKYIAWRSGASFLFQVPTALTVDAPWGHRAAVRFSGIVRYVGFAVPTAIYVDLDIVLKAPRALNISGVGDVLCFHTAHHDWKLATAAGKAGKFPYNARIAAQAEAVLNKLISRSADVRDLNDAGVEALVTALSYGGAAFHAHGWNPRPVEGFDHVFFYALEKRTGRHFIHGYPVLLGCWLGARLQENRSDWLLATIVSLGVDIRPEAMQVWTHPSPSAPGLGLLHTTSLPPLGLLPATSAPGHPATSAPGLGPPPATSAPGLSLCRSRGPRWRRRCGSSTRGAPRMGTCTLSLMPCRRHRTPGCRPRARSFMRRMWMTGRRESASRRVTMGGVAVVPISRPFPTHHFISDRFDHDSIRCLKRDCDSTLPMGCDPDRSGAASEMRHSDCANGHVQVDSAPKNLKSEPKLGVQSPP